MLRRLRRLISQTALTLATWPLKAVGLGLRADALERLTESAVSTIETPDHQLRFYTPSPLLISRASSLLCKEPDTIAWINHFEDKAVFWDIGANIGTYSLYAAACRGVTVLAFEPSAANFHVLSRNIQLNELGDRVKGYCIAFSDESKLGMLNISSPAMGAAVSQFGLAGEMSPYWNRQAAAASHGMLGFAIDEFIAQFNPPFPNYLKIDVDGLEPEILRGASVTLRDVRLESVLVEVGITIAEKENRSTVSLLEEAGFHFVSRGLIQGSGTELAANYLFQRSRPDSNRAGRGESKTRYAMPNLRS